MNLRWTILALVLLPLRALGDVTISSPVGGYYRVGKFTPIDVGTTSDVTLGADGTSRVTLHRGGSGAVVPLLVVSETRGHFSIQADGSTKTINLPMRQLGEDERLVGLVGAVTAADAQQFFPGKTIVPVTLDAARPFPGTPMAWEVLDGIVSDGTPAGVTNVQPYRSWVGGGMTLAIRAPAVPEDVFFPWQRRGAFWVVSYEPLGGTSALSDAAYAPVRSWSPGASLRTRATVLGFGVFVVIGVLAASLLRDRFFVTAALLVIVGASLGVVRMWSRRLPQQVDVDSAINIVNGEMSQWDVWRYVAAARDGAVIVSPCFIDSSGPGRTRTHSAGRPMLASPEQAERQRLTLEMSAAGDPERWTARLRRGERLAFLTRLVNVARNEAEPWSPATDSPMQSLVREFYAASGVRATGQGALRGEDGFPEVFVKRSDRGLGVSPEHH